MLIEKDTMMMMTTTTAAAVTEPELPVAVGYRQLIPGNRTDFLFRIHSFSQQTLVSRYSGSESG
jgi:hypothetical protein